jgi:hypothetical protein
MYCRVLNWMWSDVSEVRAASIIRAFALMEAERTSERSVDIQLRTRQYIPEDSELHIRRRENLKSHDYILVHNLSLRILFCPRSDSCSLLHFLLVCNIPITICFS